MSAHKTYLVTGGCGFIGSHLAEALLQAGCSVHVLDDLSDGKIENLPVGAAMIEGDLRDGAVLDAAMKSVDGVFHLAAIASVERCNLDWQASSAVNLFGSIGVFERAAVADIPVVYASSAAIYGDGESPCRRDAVPRPLSAYGVDKYAMEMHSAAGANTRGARSFGLRFFNIYGPRQNPDSPYSGVIAIFMRRIATGKRITIFGDGAQTRDFVYVNDAVRALMAAMTSLEVDPSPRAEVENVGHGIGVDLLTLTKTIGIVAGKAVEIDYAPARDGDVQHSCSEPSAKLAQLGAAPQTALDVGLLELFRWSQHDAG